MSDLIGSNSLACETSSGIVLLGFACLEHGLQYAVEFTGDTEDRILRVGDGTFVDLPYWHLPCPECGEATIGPVYSGARMQDGVLHIPYLSESYLDQLRSLAPKFDR